MHFPLLHSSTSLAILLIVYLMKMKTNDIFKKAKVCLILLNSNPYTKYLGFKRKTVKTSCLLYVPKVSDLKAESHQE